jgi:IS30 family transposase
MEHYKHLTQNERDKLAVLRSRGWKLRDIGKVLGRNPGTLSRELKRNNSRIAYLPHKAQEKAEKREQESHRNKRLKTYAFQHEIEQMLIQGWSPELVSGRLRLLNRGEAVASHESIYQWIYADAPYLAHYLVRRHKTRYPKCHAGKKRSIRIPGRVSLSERSVAANKREEPGHWETDLMVSKKSKSALQVCIERTSRIAKIKKIRDKSSKVSREALQEIMKPIPFQLRLSITYDNGTENAEHVQLNEAIGTKSYFCEPYHSWEKGSVENTNGLIRRFLPKKTDFATISDERIQEIENWLNNRPKKCLGYRTPAEVFNSFFALAP